jgi:hypothetical protein
MAESARWLSWDKRKKNPWAIQISETARHKREAREMLRALRRQRGFKGGRIYSKKRPLGVRQWQVQGFMQDEPEAKLWLPEGMRRVFVPPGIAKRVGYHGNPELMVMLNGGRRGRRNPMHVMDAETVHGWMNRYARMPHYADLSPSARVGVKMAFDAHQQGTNAAELARFLIQKYPTEFSSTGRNPRRRSRLSVRRRRSAPTIRYKGRRWYFLALRAKFGQRRAKSIWRKSRKTMRNRGGRMTSGRPKLSPKWQRLWKGLEEGMAYKRRKRLAKQLGISANRRRTRRKLLVARN